MESQAGSRDSTPSARGELPDRVYACAMRLSDSLAALQSEDEMVRSEALHRRRRRPTCGARCIRRRPNAASCALRDRGVVNDRVHQTCSSISTAPTPI